MPSINERLEQLAKRTDTSKEVVRGKVRKLILELNNGERSVSRYGFRVDILVELDRILDETSEARVERALAIMRE